MNSNPVPAPSSQPFSFPFLPETIPPMNKAMIDSPRITQVKDCSVKLENRRIMESMKLLDMMIANTTISPNPIAEIIRLDIFLTPYRHVYSLVQLIQPQDKLEVEHVYLGLYIPCTITDK